MGSLVGAVKVLSYQHEFFNNEELVVADDYALSKELEAKKAHEARNEQVG